MCGVWMDSGHDTGGCAVFFLFSLMHNTSTYPLYLPTTYSHVMSHALSFVLYLFLIPTICMFCSLIDNVFGGSRSCVMGGPGGTWEVAKNM